MPTMASNSNRGAHTPGPWRAEKLHPKYPDTLVRYVEAGAYYEVATLYGGGLEKETARSAIEANASLIAAAPELLEALAAISEMYSHAWDREDGALVMMGSTVQYFERCHEQARAAIKKARGE